MKCDGGGDDDDKYNNNNNTRLLHYLLELKKNKTLSSSSWSIQIYIGIEIYNTDIVPQVRFMA